jgi:hypothetical protein
VDALLKLLNPSRIAARRRRCTRFAQVLACVAGAQDAAQRFAQQAKILALKVLRDTIETNVERHRRCAMGTVLASGVDLVKEADRRGLRHTVDLWEAQWAELSPQFGGLRPWFD